MYSIIYTTKAGYTYVTTVTFNDAKSAIRSAVYTIRHCIINGEITRAQVFNNDECVYQVNRG